MSGSRPEAGERPYHGALGTGKAGTGPPAMYHAPMRAAGSILALALLAALPAAATPSGGRAADPAEILARLDAHLASIESMEGRFIQSFVSSGLGVPQTEEGRFAIRRPDLMRWEYRSPEEKLAVSDGRNTWLYMPEEETVYKGSVSQWKEGGAFAVLAGGSLRQEYEALSVGVEGATRKGDLLLRLKPLSPREQYEYLDIQFDPRSLALHSITAIDGMGNRVAVILSQVRENVALERSRFEFTPPEGVRVVDQSPGSTPAEAAGRAPGGP